MLTLLRPGYAKIIRLFRKEPSLHLREIARRTGLFEPSASRFLSQLEKEGVLVSKKVGNLKMYSIKRSVKTYFLFQAFDLEAFEKLPVIRRNAIRTYLQNLPEQPVFAILFGSTAKGTFKEDSDIDVLLVTNRRMDVKQAEKAADAQTAMKVSTFQMTYKDFQIELRMKEDKVVQSAIASGWPLTNHIQYYEGFNERI